MAEQRTLLTAEEFFRLYSHREGDYELVKVVVKTGFCRLPPAVEAAL
jgi:hypothetical protein